MGTSLRDPSTRRLVGVAALAVLSLFVLIAIVLARVVWAQSRINKAATWGMRYAVVSYQFDEVQTKYCKGPCPVGSVQHKQARLRAIRDAVGQSQGYESYEAMLKAEDINELRVVICSDREGWRFDEATRECLPNEDPGLPEDKVTVFVEQRLSLIELGSWSVGEIRLHAMESGYVEPYPERDPVGDHP